MTAGPDGSGAPSRPRDGWRRAYERALELGAGWIGRLRPGDRVFVGSAAGEPEALVSALAGAVAGGAAPGPLTAYQMPGGTGTSLVAVAGEHLRVVGLVYHPDLEALDGRVTFLPLGIYQIAQAIAGGRLRLDVALLQASPPDAHGYMSLGVSVDFARQALDAARLVVVETNDRSPRALGDCLLHASEVDAIVETSRELPQLPAAPADEQSRAVADHVVELVPDGATVEIGIGAVMTGVLERFSRRADLGLHTGLVIEPMMDLIEAGVVTNRRKGVDAGVTVANQCRGTERLYAFIDQNPAVSMRPASYTHDPRVLGSLRTFRAINSAIEVGLLGQVNGEYIAGRRVSSVGGLADFVRACHVAEGARSIIALRSTAKHGARSRIVPALSHGAEATLTPDLADVVVTEHGIAELRGLDAAGRVRAMIAVADPRFRDDLRRAADAGGVLRG